MSTRREWSVLLGLATLVFTAAQARGGAKGDDETEPPGKPAAPGQAPSPARPAGAAIAVPSAVRAEAASELSFGEPIRYHNITIVPVGTTRKGPFQKYTMLEQGLKEGTLSIRELSGNAEQAQVSQIEVRNSGHEPAYLLGGEMVLGGKQDRIIQQDTVLSPTGKWTKVAVFCVERGRWAGLNMQFSAGGAVAHASLRGAAMSGSQSEVWAEVARTNLSHGSQSRTDTYRRTIQNAQVRHKLDPYRRQLLGMVPRDLVLAGFIFAINGEIRVADLFGNPVLFKDLTDKLLSSYILEALETREDRRAPALSKGAAEHWLIKARSAKSKEGKQSGRAVNYYKEGADTLGVETIDPPAGESVRETYIKKR